MFRENLARYARQDNSALFSRIDGLIAELLPEKRTKKTGA